MLEVPRSVQVDLLALRSPQRATMLIDMLLLPPGEHVLIAFDAHSRELVRLPVAADLELLGLDPDGDHALLAWRDADTSELVVHQIASGQQSRVGFPVPNGLVAAATVDHHTVAALWIDDDPHDPDESVATVSMVDLERCELHHLWTAPGGFTAESGVACSPNRDLIAVTYNSPDDEPATVILNRAGGVVTELEGTESVPASNQAWLDDHTLLCGPRSDRRLAALDIRSGHWHEYESIDVPRARMGDHLLLAEADENRTVISTATIAGTERRPWLTLDRGVLLRVAVAADEPTR